MALATASLRSLLGDADYLKVWLVGLFSGICRFLEMLVMAILAFELTGSPFLVALLIILGQIPLVLLGSVVGTIADRNPPRAFLLGGMSVAALVSTILCVALAAGIAGYWAVAASSFALGVVRTMDLPLRRRLIGDIAGPERLIPAISFDSATNNSTRMIGPLIGGVIYQWLGPEGAFALMGALYAISAVLIARVGAGAAPASSGAPSRWFQDLADSLSYALRDRDVRNILLVTIVFNICATSLASMLPVIGTGELKLTPGLVGVVAGMEGAGAFLTALFLAVTTAAYNQRRIFYFGVIAHVIFTFMAASMTHAAPMAMLIFCVGIGGAGFGAMQSTLIYTIAPPQMRSRLFGLVTICIGAGAIGVFIAGLLGEWLGASAAVRIVAAGGFCALVLIGLFWPALWRSKG